MGLGAGHLHFPRFFEGLGGGRREAPRPNDAEIRVCWPLGGGERMGGGKLRIEKLKILYLTAWTPPEGAGGFSDQFTV